MFIGVIISDSFCTTRIETTGNAENFPAGGGVPPKGQAISERRSKQENRVKTSPKSILEASWPNLGR